MRVGSGLIGCFYRGRGVSGQSRPGYTVTRGSHLFVTRPNRRILYDVTMSSRLRSADNRRIDRWGLLKHRIGVRRFCLSHRRNQTRPLRPKVASDSHTRVETQFHNSTL